MLKVCSSFLTWRVDITRSWILDAGQFKVAFEEAQVKNAELLGVPIPSRAKGETAGTVEESESKSESKPEEKTEGEAKEENKE